MTIVICDICGSKIKEGSNVEVSLLTITHPAIEYVEREICDACYDSITNHIESLRPKLEPINEG